MELADWYSVSKAMHLIGMVSWMAGLFYLVRLMVNHAEAFDLEEPTRGVLIRQYELMEGRVYKVIIVAAVVITWLFGVLMLSIQPAWLAQGWMQVKLLLLLALTGYTYFCKKEIGKLTQGPAGSSIYYRALNEFPTIILAGAVFLAVFKTRINWLIFTVCILGFIFLIASAIRKVNKKK
ncbi:MAG: CopD family protein [Saprospiraceae bacterium]|jgi:putative membrane protein